MSDWGDDWGSEPVQATPVVPATPQWTDWEATATPTSIHHGRTGRGRAPRDLTCDSGPGVAIDWSTNPDSSAGWGQTQPLKEASVSGDTLTIYINSSETGRVIGRAGCVIQEIQAKSGARVKVHRDSSGDQTRIDITGSPEQREVARSLIDEKTGGVPPLKFLKVDPTPPVADFVDWGSAIRASEEATKAKWASLPPLVKDFYVEDAGVAGMSDEEASAFRRENFNISIEHFCKEDSRRLLNPTTTFAQAFARFPEILQEIEKNGFQTPSPIQAQAWPVLLSGIDVVGIAQTGSGKTLAYLLPAMIHIEGQTTPRSQRPGPSALILAPVRELAQQIDREARKYSYRGIRTICIYGGGDRRQQSEQAARGVEIVIATPGRLNDLCMSRVIDLSHVSYLVLDEADRMLDMGFEPQIRKILLDVRPDRQTVMMSATWPPQVRDLASKYLDKPFLIYVNTLDLAACNTVTQQVHVLAQEEKKQFLEDFIRSMGPQDKAIVFVGKKIVADEISSELALKGFVAQCIHGDRDQSDREQALADLKSGAVRVLVATDVASRGLDIEDITHILNLDFPRNVEEYVHRIGRTGRAGRSGASITLMTREDWRHAEELIAILSKASQQVPQELVRMAARFKEHQAKKEAEEAAYGISGRGGRRGGGSGGGFGGRRGGDAGFSDFSFSGGGGGGGGGGRWGGGPRW